MSTETIKHAGDIFSVSVVLTTLIGWLPSIAAIVSIIWTLIRIYETRTVQYWLYGIDRREKNEAD